MIRLSNDMKAPTLSQHGIPSFFWEALSALAGGLQHAELKALARLCA